MGYLMPRIPCRRTEVILLITNSWGDKKIHTFSKGINRLIGRVGRVFANGPGDLCSISGHIIPKTLKMVLDTSMLNTQRYKVCIKGKVEQSRERSSAHPYTLVL